MKKLLLATLLLTAIHVSGQEKNETEGVNSLLKITLINPGVSYEQRIGKFHTLFLQGFINTSSFNTTDLYGRRTYRFYIDPALTFQYRYYFNYNRRSGKGLRTENNNLNYLAPVYQAFWTKLPLSTNVYPDKRRPLHVVAAVWGMQRNYTKAHFTLDLNAGPGVMFGSSTYSSPNYYVHEKKTQFTIYSQLNIGFWLGK